MRNLANLKIEYFSLLIHLILLDLIVSAGIYKRSSGETEFFNFFSNSEHNFLKFLKKEILTLLHVSK